MKYYIIIANITLNEGSKCVDPKKDEKSLKIDEIESPLKPFLNKTFPYRCKQEFGMHKWNVYIQHV
jgi:hypothetical protein